MSALQLDDVRLHLGGRPVLDGLSLHVEQGEFVSILGPSGAGKSTLFRLLTGAIASNHGTILVEGQPLTTETRAFAFMPQHDALLPWRRVLDNITLGLEVQGMRRTDARRKVAPLLRAFGLDGCERHYPAQLSGGMRQRAALLRTVIQDRPIQLLDEPFGALDALTRMTMQNWLKDRWSEARWTTLLVTHDVREAVVLSDRIYVLSRRPARAVAEFIVNAPPDENDLSNESARLEAKLLDTLLTQTGDYL